MHRLWRQSGLEGMMDFAKLTPEAVRLCLEEALEPPRC